MKPSVEAIVDDLVEQKLAEYPGLSAREQEHMRDLLRDTFLAHPALRDIVEELADAPIVDESGTVAKDGAPAGIKKSHG